MWMDVLGNLLCGGRIHPINVYSSRERTSGVGTQKLMDLGRFFWQIES